MSFTRQSFLVIVMAIVASGQAQADFSSWCNTQSLKSLGNRLISELGRVFIKAPTYFYENTTKKDKAVAFVGVCALFGTGYYLGYQKLNNMHKDFVNKHNREMSLSAELSIQYNSSLKTHSDTLAENFKLRDANQQLSEASNTIQQQRNNAIEQLKNEVTEHNRLKAFHEDLKTINIKLQLQNTELSKNNRVNKRTSKQPAQNLQKTKSQQKGNGKNSNISTQQNKK